jgi:ribose transport system permease protein
LNALLQRLSHKASVGTADLGGGTAFLLPSFAAAFFGPTAIKPVRFNARGTFVGVYFLVSGLTGLELVVVAVSLGRLAARRPALET